METSAGETSFWTKLSVLILMVLAMLLFAQGMMIAYAYTQGVKLTDTDGILGLLSDPKHASISKLLIGLNHLCAFIIAPILWARFYYKNRLKEYFKWKHFDPRYIFLFILALVTMYPLMAYLGLQLDKLPLPDWAKGMDTSSMEALAGLLEMKYFSDLLLNILIVGILPGLGEELLFRGAIQNEIQKKWSNPHIAIWVAAFVFAIVHFQVSGFPAKLMIGALLGYAYYMSGSLVLPVILHATNNSMATIVLYFVGSDLNLEEKTIGTSTDIPLIGVAIATSISIFIWYTIINHYKSQEQV